MRAAQSFGIDDIRYHRRRARSRTARDRCIGEDRDGIAMRVRSAHGWQGLADAGVSRASGTSLVTKALESWLSRRNGTPRATASTSLNRAI